jgi:hypothetical protein
MFVSPFTCTTNSYLPKQTHIHAIRLLPVYNIHLLSDQVLVFKKKLTKFQEMTNDQIKSFTDDQATSVTDDQKAAMTEEQNQYLEGQATGGEEVLEEVVNKDVGDSSATGKIS